MQAVKTQAQWDFGYFRQTRAAIDTHIRQGATDTRFPMQPAQLVAEIQQVMPRDGLIALDNGIYKIWFARNYKAHFPHALLLDNALASMGAGLPSAMAASLLYPQRPTLAICGDGGFLMTVQELETAVRLGINLTILILNDGAYGMIKWKQQHMGLADFGLDFSNPDFVLLAESFGARGHRIGQEGELQAVLQACFAQGGIHIIDLPIDYSENRQQLLTDLGEQVCRFEGQLD